MIVIRCHADWCLVYAPIFGCLVNAWCVCWAENTSVSPLVAPAALLKLPGAALLPRSCEVFFAAAFSAAASWADRAGAPSQEQARPAPPLQCSRPPCHKDPLYSVEGTSAHGRVRLRSLRLHSPERPQGRYGALDWPFGRTSFSPLRSPKTLSQSRKARLSLGPQRRF